ncbi:endoplasmic reticulum junction formation protein lunapark-B-like [Halichondria panicea]|uniref:endoplasmic reticulum junction formation protein lunapark-B-like n=1 Tax=Halichondria panicea TaxID=6063 RepID=UPI00312BB9E7
MGLFFSRSKKKRSSKDILEELELSIKKFSERKRRNAQHERSFVGYLLILSFFMYLIGLLIFYLYYLPTTWPERVLYGTPFVLFPVIIYFVKKLLNMYFLQRATEFDAKLRLLHEEKRKTLNEVMEKETYKTARELLEKYDPSNPSLQTTPSRGGPRQASNQNAGQELRRRRAPPSTPHPALMPQNVAMATPQVPRPPIPMATPVAPVSNQQQPLAAPTPAPVPATPQPSLQHIPPGMCVGAAPGPPTPCPILPRDRTNVDKMVEYLVGDGPNNRYALVCSECKSHNGMALRDEFEYLAFRCAYCYSLNQARKKRPTLERPPSISGPQPTEETLPGEGAENRNGHNGNEQPSPQHRRRSRGQRSSSQSNEGNVTPTPTDE